MADKLETNIEEDMTQPVEVTKNDDIISRNMIGDTKSKEVDKMRKFLMNLTKGGDFFESASECLKYSFGQSSLKDLISDCLQSGDDSAKQLMREVVGDISKVILEASRDAIATLAKEKGIAIDLKSPGTWPVYASCDGQALTQVTGNCIVLFHAVYETRSIADIFSEEGLTNINEVYVAASALLKSIGANGFKVKLPDEVIATVDEISGIRKNREEKVERINAEFVDGCEEIFRQIEAKQYDIAEMTRIVEVPIVGVLSEAKELMRRFSMHMPSVANVSDIRVMGAYLSLLKRVFDKCENFDDVMRQFYHDSLEGTRGLPSLKKQYADFDAEFVRLMNGLGDHAQFQNEPEKFENVVRELSFLFMIAPKTTVWFVLRECISNKLIVPNVLKILRRLPSLLELRLAISGVEDCSSTRRVPIITLALRRIVQKESGWIASDEARSNFVYLVASLARERCSAIKHGQEADGNASKYGEVIDSPILSGTELLLDFVLPLLFLRSEIDVALELACRFFADYECRRTPIEWSMEVDDLDTAKNDYFTKLPAAMCVKLLVDILGTAVGKDPTIEGLCLKCLHLFGDKLKQENVLFPEKTRTFLLESFNGHIWTLKYAIFSWFAESLGKPKLQIPEGLYKSLSEERRHGFEQITMDFEFAPVESFLRSIFELGILFVDFALDLIRGGFAVKPLDGDLSVKIALALMDSLPDNVTEEKVTAIYEVVSALVGALDPTVKSNPLVFYNESTIYGLRLIAPLMVFGDAVLLAVHARRSEASNRNEIAEKLLSVWCQLVKRHIDREIIDWRRSRLTHVPDIRDPRPTTDGVVIDRLVRVKVQIAELFSMAVMISKEAESVPHQLRILLTKLTDGEMELNQVVKGSELDTVKIDSKDDGTFYAFANNEKDGDSAVAKENTIPSEGTVPALASSGTENMQQSGGQDIGRDTEAVFPIRENKFGGEGMSATNALFEINAGSTVPAHASRFIGSHFDYGMRGSSSGRRGANKSAWSNKSRGKFSPRRDSGGRGRGSRLLRMDSSWIWSSDGQDEETVKNTAKFSRLNDCEASLRSRFGRQLSGGEKDGTADVVRDEANDAVSQFTPHRGTTSVGRGRHVGEGKDETEEELEGMRGTASGTSERGYDEGHSPDISDQHSAKAAANHTSKHPGGGSSKKPRSHDDNHEGALGTQGGNILKHHEVGFTHEEQEGTFGAKHDNDNDDGKWKGYRARNAVKLEPRLPNDRPERSATFNSLPLKTGALSDNTDNSTLKAMAEQVKDVAVREVLQRRMISREHLVEQRGDRQPPEPSRVSWSSRNRFENETQFPPRFYRGRGGGSQKPSKRGRRN
uniref:Edg1 TPR repeats region domain-containing protein n=1 Tax=Parascaris univalens TaxID=6257 RepID=A0A915A5X1_PARUN